MPQHAMTVSPVYEESTGDLQDLQVHSSTLHQGGTWTNETDFVEQEDGSFRHVYQDADTNNDGGGFQWDSYLDDYISATPQITKAVEWAENAPGLPEGFAEEFNEALENENLDKFHQMAEVLLELYNEEPHPEEPLTDEQFFEQLPQEQLNAELESLQSTSYSVDQAETMVELANNFEHGSVEHSILKAGVDLAFGKADINEVINNITERYGQAASVAAYYRLQNQINN